VTDVVRVISNAQRPIEVAPSGKKTDEGKMMSRPNQNHGSIRRLSLISRNIKSDARGNQRGFNP
jgi:hypothetical protein